MAAAPLVVVVAALVTIGWWTHGFRAFTSFSAALAAAGPVPRQAPPLPVVDEHGEAWDAAGQADGFRLVQVMYLRCPDGCPIAMANLGRLARELDDLLPSRLSIVSLAIDREPPEELRAMWEAHGAPRGWSMAALTGENPDEILGRLGVWVFRRPDGLINHGLDSFLLDPTGRVVRVFGSDEPVALVASRIRELVR